MTRCALILVFLLTAAGAFAQTPTLAERATLALDQTFQSRLGMAAMQVAITVAVEPPTTASHAERMKMAVWTITEPELIARRLAVMAASVSGITGASTDAALVTLLTDNWTLVATIFTGTRQ